MTELVAIRAAGPGRRWHNLRRGWRRELGGPSKPMKEREPAPATDPLPLLQRLEGRAADPARRTDHRPGGLGGLVGRLSRFGRSSDRPRRASAIDVQAVEAALGVRLPQFLVRVYLEVADGGFGPEEGLLSLTRVVATTRRLRSGELLPRRRTWPKTLLPLVRLEQGWICVDVATGAVIDWDPEELTEWAKAARFRESFTERSPSLEAWLERWVTRKTAADRNKPSAKERKARLFAHAASPGQRAIRGRNAVAGLAQLSPAERAAMGLPEEGWEKIVMGWHTDQ